MKKSQKHETNLQKNSTLYFQIGLIVCLLAAFGLLEMKFETTTKNYGSLPPLDDPIYLDVPLIKPEVSTKNEPVKQERVKQPQNYKQVENDTPDLPFLDEPKEPVIDAPDINPDDLPPIDEPDEEVNIPVNFIQNVPIYPGCEKEKNNTDRKKCMSDKISKLIQRKFDGSNIASEYGLSGKQKIDVQFTIDKTGKVTSVKTRAPHPKLQDEAKRVINMIPEMTPGKQNNKNVGVIYTLPIIFQVQ
ncbi:hypothetical protein GCM10023330_02050 [Litoribaculum gwangyangense]|uniref:TonB C-terminal domain-containing protein n=1 Tax=Litoribaculum gwangyangense TaxID=1130722 RepID=A0ABP9BV97_9FLAO